MLRQDYAQGVRILARDVLAVQKEPDWSGYVAEVIEHARTGETRNPEVDAILAQILMKKHYLTLEEIVAISDDVARECLVLLGGDIADHYAESGQATI